MQEDIVMELEQEELTDELELDLVMEDEDDLLWGIVMQSKCSYSPSS